MLTKPRGFIDRDAPDEVIHIEPDAEAVEQRTRDLGVPDGVWWGVTALGGVATMFGVMAGLLPVSELAASTLGGGAAVAVWTVGARRWGHRRFRWRAALVDGLWFGLLATIGLLLHGVAQRLFRRAYCVIGLGWTRAWGPTIRCSWRVLHVKLALRARLSDPSHLNVGRVDN